MTVPAPGQDNPQERITVWVCLECGYWRQDKTTGSHLASNPDDPRGRMLSHPLTAVEFVPAAALETATRERDAAQEERDEYQQAGMHVQELREAAEQERDAALAANEAAKNFSYASHRQRAVAAERALADTTETFRLIAQAAGEDGTEPDDWRAMTFPTPGEYALQAVRQLRADCDEAQADLMTENMTVMRLGYAYARAEAAEQALQDKCNELLDVVVALEAAKDALRLEWEHNHKEHCHWEWPHQGHCHWPRPTALDASASTENTP